MKVKHSNLVVIFTLVIGITLMTGVQAEGPEPKVARMQVFDNFVGWEEVAQFQSVNLRISGPDGMYFEETFNQGDSIYFDLTSISAPDGTYRWELRASPLLSDEVKDWLAYAEETGDKEVLKELRRSGQLPSRALVDTGAFTVVDGNLVNPDIPEVEEEMASAGYSFQSPLGLSPQITVDYELISDVDLLVDNQACIGSSCYTSGTDYRSPGSTEPLVLRQSRTNIIFEDSSSTVYPSNDWQITANDQSGDALTDNYFAIEDLDADSGSGTVPFKIEAGAPTSSLYIDDEGNIGIGTSVPDTTMELHIIDGDDAAIRLEQDTSEGETAQIWDIVNTGGLVFWDKTNNILPFAIESDADWFSLFINSSGNIGMGTLFPDSKLNIGSDNFGTPPGDTVLHLENDEPDGFGTDLTITAANDKSSRIHFAKPADMDSGGIYYSHGTDNMTFVSAGATKMQLGPGVGSLSEVEFFGDVSITGSISKGGGGFKIDHPLEPEKKYLSHSFVESPDMMNVYNGNVELDDKGQAWIQMPNYFEALNREFRYQLTPIGGPAPSLFIAEMISANRFKIAGGPAGLLVSWQVTGVRKDTWAEANRIQVEESKSRN